MAQSITVTARKLFALSELVTSGKLNLAQFLTLSLSGTVDSANITDRAVTSAKAENFGAWFEGADTGTATDHAVAVTSGVSAYATGMMILYKVNTTNTGAVDINVTPSVSGSPIGAKNLLQPNGQELLAGMLRAGAYALVRYDGTQFQLLGCTDLPATRYVETTGSANAYVATFGGTTGYPTAGTLAQLEGRVLLLKANFTNTGAATLAVDGLAAKSIQKDSGTALAASEVKDNQLMALVYDSAADVFLLISPVARSEANPVLASSRNLIIKPNASNPTYQVDVDADEIILGNGAGSSYKASAVNLTIDLSATAAANARDAGAESNAWWYVWVCYNSADATLAGLLSLSSSTPAKPAGFSWDFSALVGVVRNSDAASEGAAAGDIVPFYQTGTRVYVNDSSASTAIPIFTAAAGPASYAALAGAAATLFANVVPPIARTAQGVVGITTIAALSAAHFAVAVAGNTAGVGAQLLVMNPGGTPSMDGFEWGFSWNVPLLTAQNLAWKAGGTSAQYRLSVSGYTI